MKKALSIILVIGIIFSCMAVTASAEGEVAELTTAQVNLAKIVKSDVNKDGSCDVNDVSEVLRAAIGINAAGDAYDIDSNGYTSTEDALALLKHLSGIEKLVSDEELLDIVNEKLNGVKTEMPGFSRYSTAKCTSMKVTQKFTAVGTMENILNMALAEMNYTDLEYDQYCQKMVEQLEKSKESISTDKSLTAAQKEKEIAELDEQIAAMKESGATYKNPEVESASIEPLDEAGHRNKFPRDRIAEYSSELAITDIKAITYSVNNGAITFTVAMNNTSYNNATYPTTSSGLANIPYGKAFNLPFLRGKTGSTLTKAEYKNGKIAVTVDKETQAITKAVYSYNYYSDVKAPTTNMAYNSQLSVNVDMSTKMSGNVVETFTF